MLNKIMKNWQSYAIVTMIAVMVIYHVVGAM